MTQRLMADFSAIKGCCFDTVNGCVTTPLLLCWHFWEKMLVILLSCHVTGKDLLKRIKFSHLTFLLHECCSSCQKCESLID